MFAPFLTYLGILNQQHGDIRISAVASFLAEKIGLPLYFTKIETGLCSRITTSTYYYYYLNNTHPHLGFPSSSDSKESACNAGDLDSIPGLGRSPGGGRGNPLQYSCLENPPGLRSLAGYNPWGHKESDTTEGLSTAQPGALL